MALKAQADILTMVMIVGIITALVGTAYLWGAPLIDKRSSFTDYKVAEGFILDLDKKITEIASSGGGDVSLKIPLGGVRAVPYGSSDADKNSIILEFVSKQPLVMGSGSYIKTTVLGDRAPYGSEPRVISVSGEQRSGKGYIIKIKLHYRELVSPNGDISLIAIDTGGT